MAQLAAGSSVHGDGKFGLGLAMSGEKTARICRGLVGIGHVEKIPAATWLFRMARSQDFFTARARSSGVTAAVSGENRFTLRYCCLPGIGSRPGIFGWLCASSREEFDGFAERIFIEAIGGGPSGAAVHNGADGNGYSVLGHVLMDGVVREAREGFHCFLDLHFGFVGTGDFAQTQDGIDAFF